MQKHILYFSAAWCAPCKNFAPQFQQVMEAHQDVSFEKVDIDKNFELARSHGVRSIPCIVLLEDGKEAGRIAGGTVMKDKLEQLLG